MFRNWYLRGPALIPSVLHACRESRRVTIATGWSLVFASQNEGESDGRIWFNFDKDILYLPRDSLEHSLIDTSAINKTDLAKIKSIAITNEYAVEWTVTEFANIEELFLCLHHDKEPWLEFQRPWKLWALNRTYSGPWYRVLRDKLRDAPRKMREALKSPATNEWEPKQQVRDNWVFLDGDVSEMGDYWQGPRRTIRMPDLRPELESDCGLFLRNHFQIFNLEAQEHIQRLG